MNLDKHPKHNVAILILRAVVVALLMCSCVGSKKVTETNKQTTASERSEVKVDSVSNVETSLPINDRIVVNVPETDNTEVMQMFNVLLQRLNTSKTSGNNSYNLRYDEETKQLIADIKVAASKISASKISSDKSTETSFEEVTDAYISKKVKSIPWWFWAILVFWFLPQIISRVKLVLNPISGFVKRQ